MFFLAFIMNCGLLLFKHHGSVTSWGRTKQHNTDVGGVPDSYHMLWMGLDIVLDVNEPSASFVSDCELMGIRAIWEVTHYHLQPLSWKF